MQYGSRNDRAQWVKTLVSNRQTPFSAVFPETYTKVYLNWNDALYNVDSNIECIPHPIRWTEDKVKHTRVMRSQLVVNILTPYLANLTDEESRFVQDQLGYALVVGQVHNVQCFDSCVQVSFTINGVGRMLLINVMNMMEYHGENNDLEDCIRRDTLN